MSRVPSPVHEWLVGVPTQLAVAADFTAFEPFCHSEVMSVFMATATVAAATATTASAMPYSARSWPLSSFASFLMRWIIGFLLSGFPPSVDRPQRFRFASLFPRQDAGPIAGVSRAPGLPPSRAAG